MSFSRKKLMGAGVAALGLILFFVLALPAWESIGTLRDNIAVQKETLDKKNNLVAKVDEFRKKTTEKQTDLNKLASILPQERKTEEVVVSLEDMAKTSGILIKTLKTGVIKETGQNANFKTLQVEVSGSGRYSAIADFIKSLEKNLRVFDVQQLTILTDTSAIIPGSLNVEVKFYTYFVE